MKRYLLLPLLVLVLAANAQMNDRGKRMNLRIDSTAIKIQRVKDSMEKTLRDVQEENNIRNLEAVMNTIEKRKKKEKNKAIIYIVIGVGLLIVLIIGLRRRTAEKNSGV